MLRQGVRGYDGEVRHSCATRCLYKHNLSSKGGIALVGEVLVSPLPHAPSEEETPQFQYSRPLNFKR